MSDTPLIPSNIPPESGWLVAALLVLGKPALDLYRHIRAKDATHKQALELREVNQREQEDRDLIALLKDQIKRLDEDMRTMRVKLEALSERNVTLERENAVLRYRLKVEDEEAL